MSAAGAADVAGAIEAGQTGQASLAGQAEDAPGAAGRAGGVFHPDAVLWRSVAGDDFAVRLSGAASGGVFALAEVTERADGGPPQAIHHDHDETIYILEGERVMRVGEQTTRAAAGAVIFVPRGTVHSHRNVGPGPHRAIVLFTPGGLEDFFVELSEAAGPLGPAQLVAIAARYGTEVTGPPMEL
jgi:quercetin dioxygenase-like cupin family protein